MFTLLQNDVDLIHLFTVYGVEQQEVSDEDRERTNYEEENLVRLPGIHCVSWMVCYLEKGSVVLLRGCCGTLKSVVFFRHTFDSFLLFSAWII